MDEDMKEKKDTTDISSGSDADGIVFEDEADTDNPVAQIKKLREKLATAIKEKQEYLNGWQRAKADLINARKRDEEDKKTFARLATEDLVAELVPVLQSFDSAMADTVAWGKVDAGWRTGVEYIASQLRSALASHGLQEINPIGQPFDHARDEAVETIPVDDKTKHDIILAVAQKGYTLNDKVIRAPRVRVGSYSATETK
jgi:molecular chaperone GrpE